jgi:hypothetical protein
MNEKFQDIMRYIRRYTDGCSSKAYDKLHEEILNIIRWYEEKIWELKDKLDAIKKSEDDEKIEKLVKIVENGDDLCLRCAWFPINDNPVALEHEKHFSIMGKCRKKKCSYSSIDRTDLFQRILKYMIKRSKNENEKNK